MSHAIVKADAHKRSTFILLSVAVLLSPMLIPSAFAMSAAAQVTTVENENHSCTELQVFSRRSKDQRVLSCLLTQLQYYQQDSMTARQQYFAYKAQAWLNYAIHKKSMNNRSSIGMQAAQIAEDILLALKNGTETDLPLIQDIPSNGTLMRSDLWATLSALKAQGGIASAPREIAFSEVALIWATNNYCERGERESGSLFRMADRWVEQAREAYINNHDSQTNVALEGLIVYYYKQYAPVDSSAHICQGQILTTTT
ncbi:hypothetical protein AAJP47_08920 [Psychrobacter sp. B38]|uniref:hypothetical protein n=1 Tax=Psychrobacter sp. B38 TaxID=3143538 RepID=UPI00320F6082